MKKDLVSLLLVFLACSSAHRDVRPGAGSPPPMKADAAPVVLHAADLPAGALELLAESEKDSCSICAREKRKEAFGILDERFPPGRIVASDESNDFRLVPGGGNELTLGTNSDAASRLAFRFHTAENHLVGVAPAEFTDAAVAAPLLTAPPGTPFRGTIRVAAYPYGDGSSFLYSSAERRLVIQCRIVQMDRN